MIIKYDQLKDLSRRVVMVDGGFDPLHWGHIKYFEKACSFGMSVLCNIQSDRYINEVKMRKNLLPEKQRAMLIDSMKFIDYVHICNTSTHDILQKIKPVKYIKGFDWKNKGLPEIEKNICQRNDIEMVYLDTNIESSTNIAENFIKSSCSFFVCGSVDKFEKIILQQKEFDSEFYDKQYFQNEWRAKGNSYSIEKRREIEAKNPFNIKEVFQPKRVLDVGCGPGSLMLFLNELGIETYGIDFSKEAKEMAPLEVKENIVVNPITEYLDLGINFDLVICRETLEHLTVLQLKKVVHVLVKYTGKFLYITTRFHPNPDTFLDITNEPHVDPSHITLMNKEFLRVLFLLEGLKSRRDLEAKMDWKGYGRVLVFERK